METQISTNSKLKSGKVIYLTDPKKFEQQEKLYLSVRNNEGRLFSDQILKILPDLNSDHPLYKEWQIRKKSLQRILLYLKRKNRPLKILDLGCGNGWMANQLAEKLNCQVYALDLNTVELEQGARLFGNNPNLNFQYGNIFEYDFKDIEFDIIVLASSIQYFSDIKKLINRLLELLAANGEIHIFDSPFYKTHEVQAARERSMQYYQKIGFPEMTNHYFHHQIENLRKYKFKTLYSPDFFFQGFINKFYHYNSPFPWIRLMQTT